MTTSDDTSTQVLAPPRPPKRWHQRWAVRIPTALAVTIVAASAVTAAAAGYPAKTTTAAKPSVPAAAAAQLSGPAATVSAWWGTTGHGNTGTVQRDVLKITGDFRGQPAGLAADGETLAADATAASQDQVRAMNADPVGWQACPAQQIFLDYSAAMGQYLAAGQAATAVGYGGSPADWVTYLGAAQRHLAATNHGLTALGLPPSTAPSIDSPDA
jgi:hypothetical protein